MHVTAMAYATPECTPLEAAPATARCTPRREHRSAVLPRAPHAVLLLLAIALACFCRRCRANSAPKVLLHSIPSSRMPRTGGGAPWVLNPTSTSNPTASDGPRSASSPGPFKASVTSASPLLPAVHDGIADSAVFGGDRTLPPTHGGVSAGSATLSAVPDGSLRGAQQRKVNMVKNAVATAVQQMQGALQAELQEEHLEVFSVLGRGGFGTVYHGARLPPSPSTTVRASPAPVRCGCGCHLFCLTLRDGRLMVSKRVRCRPMARHPSGDKDAHLPRRRRRRPDGGGGERGGHRQQPRAPQRRGNVLA